MPSRPPNLASLTVQQLQGYLRALSMPVGGTKPKLVQRLGYALEVREKYQGQTRKQIEASHMRDELVADLRMVSWPRTGNKERLALLLSRFVARPFEMEKPREIERHSLVWDHPLTGRRVLYATARGYAMAERMRGHMQADWRAVWISASKHVLDFEEPSFRIALGSSGAPLADEKEQRAEELLREIARLEEGSMGPALAGDLFALTGFVSRIERQVAQWHELREAG